jgi:hypothetical protein
LSYFKNPKRTFKRELAVALIIWLIYVVETKDASIVEVLVWPVFAFVTAAFGLDQYSKLQQGKPPQSTSRRGDQRSSQHPNWEDKYPDVRDDK